MPSSYTLRQFKCFSNFLESLIFISGLKSAFFLDEINLLYNRLLEDLIFLTVDFSYVKSWVLAIPWPTVRLESAEFGETSVLFRDLSLCFFRISPPSIHLPLCDHSSNCE